MDRELRQLVLKILQHNPQLGHEGLAAILVNEAQEKAPNADAYALASWAFKYLPDCVQRDNFRRMFIDKK